MAFARFVGMGQRQPSLPFLVIGGYAVAAHGFSRATFDIDFLCRRSDRDTWKTRVIEGGLKLVGETSVFAQFGGSDSGDYLDLMFVDGPTFESMLRDSSEREFGSIKAPVPSLEHLLALKLHALKHSGDTRLGKDASDIEMLLRRNHVDLKDSRYRELFLKYGSSEMLATFERILRHE